MNPVLKHRHKQRKEEIRKAELREFREKQLEKERKDFEEEMEAMRHARAIYHGICALKEILKEK